MNPSSSIFLWGIACGAGGLLLVELACLFVVSKMIGSAIASDPAPEEEAYGDVVRVERNG